MMREGERAIIGFSDDAYKLFFFVFEEVVVCCCSVSYLSATGPIHRFPHFFRRFVVFVGSPESYSGKCSTDYNHNESYGDYDTLINATHHQHQ